MSTYSDLEVREVALFIPRRRAEWETLLHRNGLEPSELITVAGVYDSNDCLLGCASLCLCGDTLSVQCVAIDSNIDEHGQVGRLIDFLRPMAEEWYRARGRAFNLLLFTKPEYEVRFRSLAFHSIGKAPQAVMMESNASDLKHYVKYLSAQRRPGNNGVIVMNGNPFTLGHLYLVQQAAALVDNLYIIPVRDDSPNGFTYALRKHMMQLATADMPGVIILEGSRYSVSAATFPTYFIKQRTDRTDTHIALDLDIFGRHVAPALGVTHRFVGSEPADMLTARYNEVMLSVLPQYGIEVTQIERLSKADISISATHVRKLLKSGNIARAAMLLPKSTLSTIIADLAIRALSSELDADPKPGLVTPSSCGSHTDMNYTLMASAIEALRPFFERIAAMNIDKSCSHSELVRIGIEAEVAMKKASGGVNTHKGAIFALGLMIAAAASQVKIGIDSTRLGDRIAQMAAEFSPAADTHGAAIRRKLNLRSALEMAQEGYQDLFSDWLPYYRSMPVSAPLRLQKLLVHIMAQLDDTNICHRGGEEALHYTRNASAALLADFSEQRLRDFCNEFQTRRLSPGGAADMLALTLLADFLLPRNKE